MIFCSVSFFLFLFFFFIAFESLKPSPQIARLEDHLTQLKTNKQFVPDVCFLHAGSQDAARFDELLVEDETTHQGSGAVTESFKSFMNKQALEARKELAEEMK